MNIAFSPCPNDTFIFHALVHGMVAGAPPFRVTFADIDRTNDWAANGERSFDLLKISCAALPYVLDDYALLPCGGALGDGCGPLLLVRERGLKCQTVAVPSERSTAYLLFRLWMDAHLDPANRPQIVVLPFHEIMPQLVAGTVDAGLVIHEARFTFQQFGLMQWVDLGEWWQSSTGSLIPLGAIVARRNLDHEQVTSWIRKSLQLAWEHPHQSESFIMKHAQEMEKSVTADHIRLYVNEYSLDIGERGKQSIHLLLTRAARLGLLPAVETNRLFQA
jgi:1,4-dihydroxy-6-naphthoate synthase